MKKICIGLFILLPQLVLANCRKTSISIAMIDPTDKKPWSFQSKSYLSSTSNSFVFIIPPIVGETILDRYLASRLCDGGLNAVIANVVKTDDPQTADLDLTIHNNSYVRALAGIKSIMAQIKKTHGDARFGILGMSLGGMLSSYIAGSEPRIEATVIVAAAGNAAGVLAYSDQETVQSQRERRYKLFNISTAEEYDNLLRPLIPDDPINVAKNIKPNSTYFFLANRDTAVPTKYQKELKDAIDSPLVYSMNGGHTLALIKAGTIHASKIVNFFKRRLD